METAANLESTTQQAEGFFAFTICLLTALTKVQLQGNYLTGRKDAEAASTACHPAQWRARAASS